MEALPQPPQARRVVGKPLSVAVGLAALAALPIAALARAFDDQARMSAMHVVASFLALVAAFRLLGKRELSQLSPFDLVTLMLIPEVLSGAVQGESSLIGGLVGLSALLLMVLLSSVLAHRFQVVDQAMESSPTLLVANGQMLEKNMNQERILPDELFSEMHKHGMYRLSQVRWAVLESSGNITFVPVAQGMSTGDPDSDSPIA